LAKITVDLSTIDYIDDKLTLFKETYLRLKKMPR